MKMMRLAEMNKYMANRECMGKNTSTPFEKTDLHNPSDIQKAMKHPNKLGAGAKKRKHLKGQNKVHAVMKEFKRGTLHSGSGKIVKKRSQAIAIGMSEAGLSKKKK